MPGVTVTHDCVVADLATLAAGVALGGGVRIGRAAYLGMNAAVHPAVRIGAGATSAWVPRSLRDVPDGETWAGVPARALTATSCRGGCAIGWSCTAHHRRIADPPGAGPRERSAGPPTSSVRRASRVRSVRGPRLRARQPTLPHRRRPGLAHAVSTVRRLRVDVVHDDGLGRRQRARSPATCRPGRAGHACRGVRPPTRTRRHVQRGPAPGRGATTSCGSRADDALVPARRPAPCGPHAASTRGSAWSPGSAPTVTDEPRPRRPRGPELDHLARSPWSSGMCSRLHAAR